jgi:hypothetical protein
MARTFEILTGLPEDMFLDQRHDPPLQVRDGLDRGSCHIGESRAGDEQ